MSASKTARELSKVVEPLGFVFEGVNGSGHLVFRHTETGAVWRASSNRERSAQQVRQQAEQILRHAESNSALFVRYVLKAFNVADDEQRTVRFHLGRMTQAFRAENPDIKLSKGLPIMALKNSPFTELVEAAPHGGNPASAISTWKLSGPLFGVTKEEEHVVTDVATGVADRERDPVVVAEPDVQTDRRSDGSADDDASDHPDAERDSAPGSVGVAGLTLPPLLVEQLREALSGDLRAERDLLRSTLADALGGLHKATEAIEAGLSLSSDDSAVRRSHVVGGRDTVSGQNRKPGVLILRRLDVMQEFRDELPALITAEDLRKFLVRHGDRPDLTVHAAGNVLWSLDAMGLGIERKGRGVYGWAA